jgi:hypothetical protein
MNAKHKNKNHFEMSQAQNQYHGPYSRAPTTISVAHDGGRAATTDSVPPLKMGVQYGKGVQAATSHLHVSNPHTHVHPYLNNANQDGFGVQSIPPTWLMAQQPHNYEYGEEVRAPTKVSVGPDW